MCVKRLTCMALAAILAFSLVGIPVSAAENNVTTPKKETHSDVVPYATQSFSISISAKTSLKADTSFPMAAKEVITIKASYSPSSASVNVGLVAPNGVYYYLPASDGTIDLAIEVPEKGNYTLQIQNNEEFTVDVAGFVNY